MRLTKYLPLLLLLVTARAQAQAVEPARRGVVITAEQLLAPPDAGPVLRLGLQPLRPGAIVPLPRIPRLPDPDAGLPWYPAPASAVGLAAADSLPGGDAVRADSAGLAADSAAALAAGAPVDTAGAPPGFRELELPDVVQDVADLALRVEGRGELGGAWNRFRPCDPAIGVNCGTDLFPRLRPEIQFGVQVGGTITDRIHVDVDYDQRREFDAANNISVYYQGLDGEVLQRLEMGDVSIDLPASRYLTQGIPSGNFGFKAAARVGATDVEAVWAQQKGDIATREFRLGGAGREGLVQDQELVLDDADYATGQFFFVVDPAAIPDYPHVDVLTLDAVAVPATTRPAPGRLVLYRDEGVAGGYYADQAREGKFLADATSADGGLRHSGLFTLLEPGEDYYIHSSGLWIALRAPLRDDEALAVAYVTESGTEVGDPSPESRPPGETPELRLVRGPVTIHQPGQPTWPWEMHQVYRLDSSAEVDPGTLDLVISLGHVAGGATFKEYAGGRIPLLRLFGLDDDAPEDRIDGVHVFRPGATVEAIGPAPLRGTFIVFPTLEPFGAPPPVPSAGLTAAGAAAVLGSDANPAIYQEPDPVIRRSSSRFRLNFDYRVRLEGLLSSFNLGAFGIRQGSERVTVNDRLLVRGVDYVIDYDLGLVTLLDPQATLGGDPDAEIRASWEQKALFDIAPTTVFGLNARSPLGPYGELNLVGLYQAEQAVVRRPQLGMEPGAVLLGGASGRLAFQADWLARALDAVPLLWTDSVARFDVAGELALSAPDPNRRGATYLDDFEATDEIPLSLDAFEWKLGSAPQDAAGAPTLPVPLEPENAASLVWQDRYVENGEEAGFLTARQIDQKIAFAGARLAERVLYLTLDAEPRPRPAPHWRSLTTVVSETGRDLSRSEYLEFYARPDDLSVDDAMLVVDIGTVSEDAFYFDDGYNLNGTGPAGQAWGIGLLDEEARLALRDVWGPDDDALGIWGQTCEADRLSPVPLGDPRANCTRNNGRPDGEDLNGNGVLDAMDGPSHRYVIPLDRNSPYLVRGQAATGTGFRLFRIPLRGPGAIPLNGATEASWRFVKHIRLTVVKPRSGAGTLALARLRIAGSRWTKRATDGVLSGLLGDEPGVGAGAANLRVGPVSRLTEGDAYASPPGVEDELQDPKAAIGASGVEFNEKSLRLTWDALAGGERGEVYYRYPQQPRSFLEYRELRFWAVPRRGRWGPDGDHRLLVKLGTDARNYYLYQTPLQPVPAGGSVTPRDWLPEHVIDFEEWFALKAEAEERLAVRGGTSSEPLVVWSADSTYAVVMEDRARAPNLAAVRELTFAVYNTSLATTAGEVWLNELRLGAGSRAPGVAGRIQMDLDAGGFLTAGVTFGGRGGRFRQLDDRASYQSSDELVVNTTAELGRLAPESWGVSMPVTVSYLRTSLDPQFLQGTDIRAGRLDRLRATGSTRRRVGVSLRKTTPSSNPLVAALVDGTALRFGTIATSDRTVTTAARLDGVEGGVDVDRPVASVALDIVPGFVESALRWLAPARVERSAFFRRLTGARLRLTPERIGLSASYTGQEARVWRYDRVLESTADRAVAPTESPRRFLESGARVALRPLESVTARVAVTSGHDVLEPERATTLADERAALRRARSEVLGVPIGWERDRVVTSDAAWRPVIADWLRPSLSWNSRFGQRRDPSNVEVVDGPDGDVSALQRTFQADRRWSRSVLVDIPGAARAALLPEPTIPEPTIPAAPPADTAAPPADSAAPPGEPAAPREPGSVVADRAPGGEGAPLVARLLVAALAPLKPVELSWTEEVGSRFDRELAAPGVGYQLGMGRGASLRVLDGDTAATALTRDAFRARSGVRLGASAAVDVGYSETRGRVHDIRAGRRDQLERAWPDVRVSWNDVPLPAWLPMLERWSITTGFARTERVTTLRGGVERVLSQRESTVPVEVRVGFPGGLSLAYIASVTRGRGGDPTGRTEQESLLHGVDLSGRFTPPPALRSAVPEPVRVSLAYDYQDQRQCRAPVNPPNSACTGYIDYLNRRLNLSLSTLVSQMDVGLQVSYVDRRSFIGTQAGSSQFQLGLFGQFNVQAGRF